MQEISSINMQYWKNYEPGEIPSVPEYPPESLLENIKGPLLDVGTGDGKLAEYLVSENLDVYGVDIIGSVIESNVLRATKVKYSRGDITKGLDFPDNFFDLIIFKFVLTNIHKDSWEKLSNEVLRLLKHGGKVWVLEPLVSDSYKDRYSLAKYYIEDKHCVYVFKEKDLASKLHTKEDLDHAIKENMVSRIVKHYEILELKDIFKDLKLESYREITIVSPSGYDIKTFEGVFVK